MPKKEAPLSKLQDYLPPGTGDAVIEYLHKFRVHLTVARERRTLLGDYRHRTNSDTHRISVNGNLNSYAFLITLLHELAHLLTFEQYGNRVYSHGKEWKGIFGELLLQFLKRGIFPADITYALTKTLQNPAASSCADDELMRVLSRYDKKKEGFHFVEDLPEGALFSTEDGRVFKKGERLRKRFQCVEVSTKRLYLFSPVYEVRKAG